MLGVFILAGSGCKTRRVLERSPLVPLNDNALLQLVDANTFEFTTLNGKMSVTASSDQQNGSFKMNLRMRSDSAIWMSITPALGIEAARAVIAPDSLKFIDKMKNLYYLGSIEVLDSLVDYYAEFELIQNLLTGNPVQISPDEKYTASVEGLYYVLSTKAKRKLRKSMDSFENLKGEPAIGVVKERKFEKAIEKYSDEDLIIKRYYIRPGDFKVMRTQIDDVLYRRSLQVEYSDFQEVEGQSFPMGVRIALSSPTQSATFELSYTRIRINEVQSYPFKIPAKYTAIR